MKGARALRLAALAAVALSRYIQDVALLIEGGTTRRQRMNIDLVSRVSHVLTSIYPRAFSLFAHEDTYLWKGGAAAKTGI